MTDTIRAGSYWQAFRNIVLTINDVVYFAFFGLGALSVFLRLVGPTVGLDVLSIDAPLRWQVYLIVLIFFSQLQFKKYESSLQGNPRIVISRVLETISIVVAYFAAGLLYSYDETFFPAIFLGIASMVFWILIRDGSNINAFLIFLRILGTAWFALAGLAEILSDLPNAFFLTGSWLILLAYIGTIFVREAQRIQSRADAQSTNAEAA